MKQKEYFYKRNAMLASQIIKALKNRKFDAYYCETGEEAARKALSLIDENSSVSWGGSETIKEIGLLDMVKNGGFTLIDRDEASSMEERFEIMRKSLLCDTYLTSSNAISEDGELVNVDGFGNRVAAMTFGPRSVIVVIGMNKVCRSAEDSQVRARTYAAPLNAARLSIKATPCGANGYCADCRSDECLCSYIVTTRMCKVKGRIKVILVGESLGI